MALSFSRLTRVWGLAGEWVIFTHQSEVQPGRFDSFMFQLVRCGQAVVLTLRAWLSLDAL